MLEKIEYWLVLAVARALGWMPRDLAGLFAGGSPGPSTGCLAVFAASANET